MKHEHTRHARSHSCLRREMSSVSPEKHHRAGKLVPMIETRTLVRYHSGMEAPPPETIEMPGLTGAVPGSRSLSWQVVICFYVRNHCRLMSGCTHTLSLPRSPPYLGSSSTPRRYSWVVFQVVDSVCWE